MGSLLRLRGVRHRRGGRAVLAIDQLDLSPGERLAVLGPNGAGKTTLLRLLAGLETPTSGSVEVDGVPTTEADAAFRRAIGYATQRPNLLSTSVLRNVELPLRWRGVGRAERRRAALLALERLNVAGLAERKALGLSGGEAQRVSLARALALEPALLLLDEPAAGLDAEARHAFFDDLEEALADGGVTVVHVSHRAEEALRLADHVAVLVDGGIRQLGGPAAVVRYPADATVARLVGYENVVPVQIVGSGEVVIDGMPCGVPAGAATPGPATLAVWAAGVRVVPRGEGPLPATVERVAPGAGRWEITLAAGERLLANLPLADAPPAVDEEVAVSFEPAQVSLIARS